ncbi:MAG: hypothetical protein ABGW74_04210 [Campylobacterales bacterium]
MKKIIVVFIFIFNNLLALDKDSTLKIYNNIITSIVLKQKPTIYVVNKEYRSILKISKDIIVVSSPQKASIALVTNEDELINVKKSNPNLIIFATKESLLFKDSSVVGAFYWKKGRSQLIFIKDRLAKYHIKLPKNYNNFIIEL